MTMTLELGEIFDLVEHTVNDRPACATPIIKKIWNGPRIDYLLYLRERLDGLFESFDEEDLDEYPAAAHEFVSKMLHGLPLRTQEPVFTLFTNEGRFSTKD